jgi:hypothetical protein
MFRTILTTFFSFCSILSFSQTIPQDRVVDWSVAGIKDSSTAGFTVLDAVAEGLFNDGQTPCDYPLGSLMLNHQEPIIVYFPPGQYLFNSAIPLRSNMLIRGAGATNTKFIIDHAGSGNGINILGSVVNGDTSTLIEEATKGANFIRIANPSLYQSGDWIQLIQNDSDWVTSSWALNSVGQIAQVAAVAADTLYLDATLRMNYTLSRNPKTKKIIPVSNVGIECLSIERLDNCAPEQASVIHFDYVVNCWVNGIESNKTTFAHIEASHSSNLSITNSYFHHAFEYGGGGRAYGVMLHFTTNECLIYSNIFERLRHSMIVQAGANGNVFCYNRSIDPYWNEGFFFPSNSAGDMVLHGNYVYANLFEQNDGQNIVIDNSHGANGPHNTFFRNRGSLFGIFFSDNTSPNQNLVGNEIPNTSAPYSTVNYTIQGTGHFVYGNNNKGTIAPSGTSNLPDTSYYFGQRPDEIISNMWASIGTPNVMNSGSIPATYFYNNNQLFANACGYTTDLSIGTQELGEATVFPNPAMNDLYVNIEQGGAFELSCMDMSGRLIQTWNLVGENNQIQLEQLATGSYYFRISSEQRQVIRKIVVVRD